MRQIFLDTETTGLFADAGDRIIEIGCIELFDRRLTGNNLHYYVNPKRESHPDALKVHGITSEFLRDKPEFFEIAGELKNYLNNAEVFIHNAAFDLNFLDKEFKLCGYAAMKEIVSNVIDTLRLAKEVFPGKRNSLDALCERLGVDNSSRKVHGALLDAELLSCVYINLTRGQEVLLIDNPVQASGSDRATSINLRTFTLPVIFANSDELVQHKNALACLNSSTRVALTWGTEFADMA